MQLDYEAFVNDLARGRKVEAWDPMPEEYREDIVRLCSQQAIAELVGSCMFGEWVDAAPTLERKATLLAKIQDEIGHGHVNMRVCEDLRHSREQIMQDYLEGKVMLLNTFHYEFESWPEIATGRVLMTGAALVQFQSLAQGSYLPYVRALKKILKEESFHYHEAVDLTLTILAGGSVRAIELLQRGVELWYPRVLSYFGPPDKVSTHTERLMRHRLKVHTNDDLRQLWLSKVIPLLRGMGLIVPDPELRQIGHGVWTYTQPDWDEVKAVIKGGGPVSDRRRQQAKAFYEGAGWIRESLSAPALVA
jgi:ring-1,2-phenylacetyl-CoA epoxidase subunit PaaA